MKCKNCNKTRNPLKALFLYFRSDGWIITDAFGRVSGEFKGRFNFCNKECKKEYLLKYNCEVG